MTDPSEASGPRPSPRRSGACRCRFTEYTVISRFSVNRANPNDALEASEEVILVISQPEPNHNGGQIYFGPDGYLYIGMGDGGGAGDVHGSIGNGQATNTFLGKMLRIDVEGTPDPGSNYAIPSDNPFLLRGIREFSKKRF